MFGSDAATLIESWKEEESRPFTGWDFSYLDGRMLEDQPPWSYLTRADELMCQSTAVLDMGTGGGERLLRLREHWPGKVVANRHSGLNCDEVARILLPGGTFLTQQVHGLWAQDLLAVFGVWPQWPDATPADYLPRLKGAGLQIERAEEWQGRLIFTDVGAIVYYLKAVPWNVPDFSVERHREHLLGLQRRLENGEVLAFVARKFIIEARKAA